MEYENLNENVCVCVCEAVLSVIRLSSNLETA